MKYLDFRASVEVYMDMIKEATVAEEISFYMNESSMFIEILKMKEEIQDLGVNVPHSDTKLDVFVEDEPSKIPPEEWVKMEEDILSCACEYMVKLSGEEVIEGKPIIIETAPETRYMFGSDFKVWDQNQVNEYLKETIPQGELN